MITPEYLDQIVEGTQKQVTFMQTVILKRICDRVWASYNAGEDNILIPSTINELHQLMDMGMMKDEIQDIVEKSLPNIQKEIRKAFLLSANEISSYNTDIAKEIVNIAEKDGISIEIPQYEKVGLPKTVADLNMTAKEVRTLEQVYHRTTKVVDNLCHTLPELGNDKYVEITDKAFLKARAGVPIGEAIMEGIKEATANGIKVVSYASGHIDTVEVAIARAVRSGIAKANAEIVLTRCGEMGVGYVKVSEHYGARVTDELDYTNHSWWQGKVYELDFSKPELKRFNKDVPITERGFKWLRSLKNYVKKRLSKKQYPDFIDNCGYGKLLGIAGVNCRHTFSAFFPDLQEKPDSIVDYVDNKDFYEKTQKQRALERGIRKIKTEINNLEGINDASVIQAKVNLYARLDKKMNEYIEFCDDNKLKIEGWRLQISERDNYGARLLQSKSKA